MTAEGERTEKASRDRDMYARMTADAVVDGDQERVAYWSARYVTACEEFEQAYAELKAAVAARRAELEASR